MLILILLGVLLVFLIASAVFAALHFLFWVAVVLLIVVGAFRLGSMGRRRSRR